MSRLTESWTYRAFRSLIYERFTSVGLVFFYVGLASNVFNGGSSLFKTHLLGSALAGLMVISMFSARRARRRCRVTPSVPGRVTQGLPFEVFCQVENVDKRVAREVNLRLVGLNRRIQVVPIDGVYLGDIAPGERASGSFQLLCPRRGRYVVEAVRATTLFPLGLWRDWYENRLECSFLVYPRFTPLLSMEIPVGRKYQPGGMSLTSNVGDSTEFLSTREFRPGDSQRMIHWRSWARRGKPVVKEFQEEFFCRIALVLDTFIPKSQERRRRADFEASLSLAAAVSDQISRDEYVIDLFAAGPELYQLQAGRSLAHLENVLDILACVEPCFEPAFQKLEPVLLDGLENVTTTVVILLAWDEARMRLLRAIQERGCALKVLFVGDDFGNLGAVEDYAPGYQSFSAAQITGGVDRL